jgi:hypothetical protein
LRRVARAGPGLDPEVESVTPMPSITFLEDEARLAALVKPYKTLVHYKGFGPSIDISTNPPLEEMIRTLSATDVLVFDGDDYSDASFTHAIPKVLEILDKEQRPPPILLALKFLDEKDAFVQSWTGVTLPASFTHPIYCFLVPRDQAVVPKFYDHTGAVNLPGEPCTLTPSQEPYTALGVYGIDLTRRLASAGDAPLLRSVVVWGGWYIVLREFQMNAILWGDEAPKWTYFHTRRRSPAGVEQEGVLASVSHPLLTIKR